MSIAHNIEDCPFLLIMLTTYSTTSHFSLSCFSTGKPYIEECSSTICQCLIRTREEIFPFFPFKTAVMKIPTKRVSKFL